MRDLLWFGKKLKNSYGAYDIISTMKNKKPELYRDEKGNPRGYRVGSSNDVYGICPFCGKSYAEEDIKNGNVNFEHVFSRFAAKKAIGEKKVFSKIESEFMVAVHKDCNDRCSNELEKHISRIVNNFNKPNVSLTQQDALILFNYCIKTSVFLRYLFLWDEMTHNICYDDEKVGAEQKNEQDSETRFYKSFDVRLKYVDASSGLYWGLRRYAMGKYCFSIVFECLEISFFVDALSYKYEAKEAIFVSFIANRPFLLSGIEYEAPNLLQYQPWKRQRLPWVLAKYPFGAAWRMYDNHILTLSGPYDDSYGMSKNYFVRQKKLSEMSDLKFVELLTSKKGIDQLDKNIVFYRNGTFYFIDNVASLQNLSDLPQCTEIPAICFKNNDIPHLPKNMSDLVVMGDFVVHMCRLQSLANCPKFIRGKIFICGNNLISLEGAPNTAADFYCDFNKLTTLKGAPQTVNGNFSCEHNELSSLISAPTEVRGIFTCRNNQLTSLEGAPRKVEGFFDCSANKLRSFNCGNTMIDGTFYFDAEHLESLDGLPKARKYFVADVQKEFGSPYELRVWFMGYKKEQKTKGLRNGVKIVGALDAEAQQSDSVSMFSIKNRESK